MPKNIKLPLPKNITESHSDFAYWQGLADILSRALSYDKVTLENIKIFYKTFSTLNEQEKRGYLVDLNNQLEEMITTIETALMIQDSRNIESDINWILNKFPRHTHKAIYSFLSTGVIPYEDFFKDIEYALRAEKENKDIDYDDFSVYNTIDELRDRTLRLDGQGVRNKAENTKPVSQTQLNSLLESTSKIKENLDQTPEYGYNELINKKEQKQNPAKMAKRNLDLNSLINKADNDRLIKIPQITKNKTTTITDSILNKVSLINNDGDDYMKPKKFNQDQIKKLNNIKKI